MTWSLQPRRRHTAVALGLVLGLTLLGNCEAGLPAREACSVLRVRDGDSLTLICGPRNGSPVEVRLWGIDAPEIGQEPWGERAYRRLHELAAGRVILEPVDRDRYGRVVGRLYRRERDIGLQLVREGYVAVYERYNSDPTYYRARRQARGARRGIWSRPGLQQAPWRWRTAHPRD
jgi:micrococcal nuclease